MRSEIPSWSCLSAILIVSSMIEMPRAKDDAAVLGSAAR